MTNQAQGQSPFSGAAPGVLALLLAQAQDRIKAQVELARGSDSRGQALLTVSVGFLGLSITASLTALNYGLLDLIAPLIGAALCFMIAASLAIYAIRPCDISFPGWEPADFLEDIQKQKEINEIISEMLPHLEKDISFNADLLSYNSRITMISMIFFTSGFPYGVLVFAIDKAVVCFLASC